MEDKITNIQNKSLCEHKSDKINITENRGIVNKLEVLTQK